MESLLEYLFRFVALGLVQKLGSSLLVLALAILVGRLASRVIMRYGLEITKRTTTGTDDYLVLLASRGIEYAIYLIGLMTILSILNISITPLLTGAGVVGLIIGLAGREVLANILSGIFIIADRPYDIGDRILLPRSIGGTYGSWGDVIDIGLRSTRVLSTDGVLLTVPNSMMTNDVVVNFSHSKSPNLRVRVRIGLEPEWDNIKRAVETVREIVATNPHVSKSPREPQVVLRDIQEYDVLLEARFYVDTPRKMRTTKSEVIEEVLRVFEERDIKMSTPVTAVQLAERPSPETSLPPEAT
ncbi:MAG: mechanosensitive ion channel family protein [Anaerolineae bacterium]